MDMDTSQNDELSQLFARNMRLAQQQQQQYHHRPQAEQPLGQPPNIVFDSDPMAEHTPMHYVSSHYTGTAHLTPSASPTPTDATATPPTEPGQSTYMPSDFHTTLLQHFIDPSALLPAQVNLYLASPSAQRLRLLELWRTAPPSYPLEAHLQGHWQTTSMIREESEARMRYETKRQNWVPQPDYSGLSTNSEPSRLHTKGAESAESAEPYILSVYSQRATDPVYDSTPASSSTPIPNQKLWQPPSIDCSSQFAHDSMEDQYGGFEQIRNHAEWESMNEKIARERLRGYGGGGGNHQMHDDDDEMEL